MAVVADVADTGDEKNPADAAGTGHQRNELKRMGDYPYHKLVQHQRISKIAGWLGETLPLCR